MILVLGGAGYIGSHTVKRLLRHGRSVLVYDDLSQGHAEAVSGIPFVKGDIGDTDLLARTMKERDVKAVIHFAAHCYVGESVEKPLKYYGNNVAGTLCVLDAMQRARVDKIIFSSSAAVYGIPSRVPITEDLPKDPINPYGRTKLIMEQMLADFERAYGTRYTALRYFNAAGADGEGVLGEWHDPETHIIPLACAAALGRRKSFSIYGNSYDTPDGTCIRDYIHVDDLAEAHVLALERLMEGGESISLNLGNGEGFSVREVVETVRRVSGRDFTVEVAPPRPGDPGVLVADAAKAGQELGWTCRSPDLDGIVKTAYDWLEKRPKGYSS